MTDIKRVLLLSAGLLLFGLLSGCATLTKSSARQSSEVKPDTVTPNMELAEAAVSVSRSLSELAAMERASTPASKTLCCVSTSRSTELPGTVSIDWSGPVEPLLQQVAAISGYRFRVLGAKPAIPAMITLNAKDVPLASVVRDIDFQSGKKASVMVYPQTRIIELRYMRP